jgi:hypothetical protein
MLMIKAVSTVSAPGPEWDSGSTDTLRRHAGCTPALADNNSAELLADPDPET